MNLKYRAPLLLIVLIFVSACGGGGGGGSNNPITISVAAFDTNITIGSDVMLDATASVDSNGHALTFQWSITQSPPESGMPLAYSGAQQTLRFDAQGVYVLELEVSNGTDQARRTWNPLDVTVFEVKPLANAFGDAEYDGIN
ncbi:MAG: PKD domain-containing protein, partial [Gammaproteobacteria bacterium]